LAAGDITAVLVTKVRTILDEDTAGLYSTTQIYTALSDAQREIAGHFLAMYKAKLMVNPSEQCPDVILPLLVSTTSATGTQNLPTDYWDYLSITGGSSVNVRVRPMSRTLPHEITNTYLTSSSSQPYCYINSTQVVFETSVSWIMNYFKTLSDLSASVDPILPVQTYNAMVQYAFANLLERDHDERAMQEFNKFVQMLQNIS